MTYICVKLGNHIGGGDNMLNKKRKEKSEIIATDPFGSYTGIPLDPQDKPIQDADDL